MNTIIKGFWSGVAEVIPRAGNDLLAGADGAYVGTVGLADSMAEFLEEAKSAFDSMDFDVIEISNVEFIESVEKWTGVDEVIRERASALSAANPVEVGSFHCYRGCK